MFLVLILNSEDPGETRRGHLLAEFKLRKQK